MAKAHAIQLIKKNFSPSPTTLISFPVAALSVSSMYLSRAVAPS